MAKGDGSINEIRKKDGSSYRLRRWKVRIDCGTDPLTKKRKVISRTIHGTKSDACKERDRIKSELESGLSADGERMTFGEFALQWQEGRESAGEISRTRLRRERTLVESLVGYIGATRLRDVTPQTVEALYKKIRGDRTKATGKCSGTTMNMYHKLLKMIMSKAVDYELVLRNPVDRVKAPRCETPDRRPPHKLEGVTGRGNVSAGAPAGRRYAGLLLRQGRVPQAHQLQPLVARLLR